MQSCVHEILHFILGWPLIVYVLGLSLLCTIASKCIQLRYFFTAWATALRPAAAEKTTSGDMTPLQAFINTLSSNLGNSSLAGMATALFGGGPGAAIWVLIAGFLLMAVRFAEIYLSLRPSASNTETLFGGPMRYLHEVPFGATLAYVYAMFGLCYGLLVGNAVQTNSIALSLHTTWKISPYISAAFLFLFVAYVMSGGAQRIAKMNEAIVPIKVAVFFSASIVLLAYHYQALIPSLKLMFEGAFTCRAMAGGFAGFVAIQMAMRFGISRVVFATESGLGTAAIMFGSTGSKQPVKDALLGMLSTFISSVVCFLVAWCIVASGVWNNGLTSTALTISSFETVFGSFAGWIVSFLSLTFGAGVLVAYGYITQETWRYVTDDRYPQVFIALFCATAFLGAVANVDSVWFAGEVSNAGMLFINLFGITFLLPVLYKGIHAFQSKSD